jgi:hypothetical protein
MVVNDLSRQKRSKSPCYALSDACFAGSESSDKKKYGTGLLFFKLHDSDLLYYAVFDFFKAVMVFVQDLPCTLKIDAGSLLLPP